MSHIYSMLISGTVVVAVTAGLVWGHTHIQHEHINHAAEDTEMTALHEAHTDEHDHGALPPTEELTEEERSEAVRAAIADGRYQCCLTEACTSCFVRHQGESDQLLCDCLEDLVTGEAPCRACVEGIMAGDGNQYLAEYFAASLSERMGADRYPELVALMTEHYGIPVEQQY